MIRIKTTVICECYFKNDFRKSVFDLLCPVDFPFLVEIRS